MKRPRPKRIKLRVDGFYYPQSKWLFFFWCDYDAPDEWCMSSTSVRYENEQRAREFLDKQNDIDLAKIELAKQAKVIKWEEV